MARDLNHAYVVGRIGNDIEVKQTKNGVDVVDFTLANNRDYGDNTRVNWVRCRAYKGLATMMGQYVKKGIRVGVSGELTVDRWQDPDGNWKERTYILVNEFQFLDANKSDNSSSKQDAPKQQQYREKVYESYEPYDYENEF
jgi:single-strand DNA-binding protein